MTGESTVVEGEIVALMETWPLQLDLETDGVTSLVRLHPETRITDGGQPVEPHDLEVGSTVRVEGLLRGERTIRANAIELVRRP